MTHLIMTRPSRSIKYMYALCCAKYIVSSDWLVESANAGYFLPEDEYQITDLDFDGIRTSIKNVLKSPIRNKLFEGKIFFLTPSVKPGVSHLKNLIELCGGKVENNRRSTMIIQEAINFSENSYIIISCAQDIHLITFRQFVCHVCSSEFVLSSIMTQSLNFSAHAIKYA